MKVLAILIGIEGFSGCRPAAVEMQVHGQKSLEQLGLRAEVVCDFDRSVYGGASRDNLGRIYRERGDLVFDLFTLRNVGESAKAIRTELPAIDDARIDVFGRMFLLVPMDGDGGRYFDGDPLRQFVETHSRFSVVGAEWVFASGGVEPIETGAGDPLVRRDFRHLRPNEAATLRLHLRLADENELVPSLPMNPVGPPYLGFMAAEVTDTTVYRELRAWILDGWFVSARFRPRIVARDEAADETYEVFFSAEWRARLETVHPITRYSQCFGESGAHVVRRLPIGGIPARFERLPIFVE